MDHKVKKLFQVYGVTNYEKIQHQKSTFEIKNFGHLYFGYLNFGQ